MVETKLHDSNKNNIKEANIFRMEHHWISDNQK